MDFQLVALCKSITACCFFFSSGGCFVQHLETVFYFFRFMGSGVFHKLRGPTPKRRDGTSIPCNEASKWPEKEVFNDE